MFYGHFRSSTTNQTGCVHEFITVAVSSMSFPPQMLHTCPLCSKEHAYRFVFGHIASTPKQIQTIEAYCTNRGIEQNVAVTKQG